MSDKIVSSSLGPPIYIVKFEPLSSVTPAGRNADGVINMDIEASFLLG